MSACTCMGSGYRGPATLTLPHTNLAHDGQEWCLDKRPPEVRHSQTVRSLVPLQQFHGMPHVRFAHPTVVLRVIPAPAHSEAHALAGQLVPHNSIDFKLLLAIHNDRPRKLPRSDPMVQSKLRHVKHGMDGGQIPSEFQPVGLLPNT